MVSPEGLTNGRESPASTPLISVIVPCYNQGRYLAEALESVLQQTYKNWECLIINDGSEDHTEKIAANYVKKDSRFRYTYKKNGGLSSARNRGLQQANGSYIQFLDGDDFLHPEKLATAMQAFRDRPHLKLILSNYQLYLDTQKKFLDPNYDLSKPITYESVIGNWDISFAIPIHCGLFEKGLVKNGFNESIGAKEDWLMWICIFKASADYYFIKDHHVYYRMHDHNMIKNYRLMQENTLFAYRIIHEMVADGRSKDVIFNRYVELSSQKIQQLENEYSRLLSSNSYKAGNLLIKPLSVLKNWVNRIFK